MKTDGQLFPRLSGGVESRGVLSLSAGSRRRGSRGRRVVVLAGADLRADQVSCIRLRVRHWRWLNVALLACGRCWRYRRARRRICSRGRS